jgi:ATP-dependent exoDNAse (exonuclease V) beta subunit
MFTLIPVLEQRNLNERDKFISLDKDTHIYTVNGVAGTYTSVTTWIHSHFKKFDADEVISNMKKGKRWGQKHKYFGREPESIKLEWEETAKTASKAGEEMHSNIECFMNDPVLNDYRHIDLLHYHNMSVGEEDIKSPEWQYFLQYIIDHPNKRPYRTEWLVFHEEYKLAGSIDMLYINDDGTYDLMDWKRSKNIEKDNPFNKFAITDCIKNIPDTNLWHYTMQLNVYRKILQEKYNIIVKNMHLLRLHPIADTYELIQVPAIDGILNMLLK